MVTLREVGVLLSRTYNPFSVILDRLNVLKQPYQVRFKNGVLLELRPGTGDRFGLYEVLIRGDYTNFGQSILPGDTVVDVGANIGCFSILASKMVGPQGRVIAIEPEEATFLQLERNVALNQARNIVAYRMAVGGQEGSTILYSSQASSLFSSVVAGPGTRDIPHTVQTVKVTTLQRLLEENRVRRCSYLKIDCEGAEYEILGAMSQETAACIKQISIEVHRIPNREPSEIHALLHARGFRQVSNDHVYYFEQSTSKLATG